MSQQRIVYQWVATVRNGMAGMTKPVARNLAIFSFGLARARRCTLTQVAEQLWPVGKPDSLERRLQRLLANTKIDGETCLTAWTAWVLRSLAPGPVHLLVDETSLQGRLKVMVVALAYRKRALPLAWWCYRQDAWPMGHVALILTLLQWVAKGVPSGRRILVQADRGIGSSPSLLSGIAALGWTYLVRVPRHVRLRLPDGHIRSFGDLAPSRGAGWDGTVHAFKKAGWVRLRALAIWGERASEPWLLVTNAPDVTAPWYGLRMWEEEAFKDLKSNGWQWQRSRVWDPQRANRLWLLMALAYFWMLSLGTQVCRRPSLRRRLTRGRSTRLSVYHLGLRHFQCAIAHQRLPPVRLRLIPGENSVV